MSKQSYKIPASLDKSFVDMELAIQNKDGIGARPLPVKTILTVVCSILICAFAIFKTPVSVLPIPFIILFVIIWAALTILLCKKDKTNLMQMAMLPTLINYFAPGQKKLTTRSSEKANPFMNFVGVENVSDKGMLTFVDGSYGYVYRVVGSASILLFDQDRDAIIDRVDSFYRKIGTDCEIITVTSKESQKIYRQLAALQKRYNNMRFKDPDLKMLAEEQFDILKNHVGGTFKSIHQYMIIKADNKEALMTALSVFQSEYENSALMIRRCSKLKKDDVLDFLKSIYQE